MIEKILIANRGEVACRIIKTAKKMDIKTVAVYSEADTNALHVLMADEAVLIGRASASESYLNIKKIIEVCKKNGVKYVHPGWGFLSENYRFVQALEKENIVFIGPSANAIKILGDKINSKKIAKEANVSIVPGDNSVLTSVADAKKSAKKIHYPVILKASAGGGGKGIRIVLSEKEMSNAFESVKNEAKNSFADDRIFIEKYIENPRHIEIQIVGDKYGNIVCLGERECSIQRNHQKIIEESPSSFVDSRTRKKMYTQTIALAKKVGYFSVGTVEYMMDKDKKFYFLEMNTRLQVEHSVTEYVTGLDLVKLMIDIAKGKELPFKQKDVKLNGWAIETRINAEDPTRGFLPSSGRITKYIQPVVDDNIRIDTGVYEGYTINMFYDSMIAKLITYGKNRNEAIERMRSSLGSFYIEGISHNIPFLETVMHNERFISGDISTNFIKQEFSDGFSNTITNEDDISVLIGTAIYIHITNANRLLKIVNKKTIIRMIELSNKWIVDINKNKYFCIVSEIPKGITVDYGVGFVSVETSWQFGNNIFRGEINGGDVSVKIIDDNKTGRFIMQFTGINVEISVRSTRISELEKYMIVRESNKKQKNLKAPITGKIVRFMVNIGDEIKAGTELLVIEAMKMENIIRSDFDTKIKDIKYKDGDLINSGEVILEFE